jgi:hypothetical protein
MSAGPSRNEAQFRLEALNAFNPPLFRSPNTSFQGVAANGKAISSFGEILSQGNIPRFVQLALRFYF